MLFKVFLFIIRKTYGWNKTWDRITYGDITRGTGIGINNVHRVLVSLKERNMILKKKVRSKKIRTGGEIFYAIEKNYDRWKPKVSQKRYQNTFQ